jgi:hypothetical protein
MRETLIALWAYLLSWLFVGVVLLGLWIKRQKGRW